MPRLRALVVVAVRPRVSGLTPKYVHAGVTDDYTVVTYYHCPGCAHVWSVDKREPARVTHITPLPQKKRTA